jgi:hypothetical protein
MRHVLAAPLTTIPSDVGDPLLNAAILYWNATQLPLTHAWWSFPAYAPAEGVTTFTENLLGLWPFASPVVWLTDSAALAYNITFFLSFVVNALAMFALVRWLTGSDAGALAAALAFTFNPYRGSHFAHIQILMTWGMPVALLGLHRYVDDGRSRWLALFGAGWIVTALSNGYYLVFFAVYVACWVLWFGTTRTAWPRLRGIAAAGLIASLPLVPVIAKYVEVHRQYGFVRSLDEIRGYSADVTGLFKVHPEAVVARQVLPAVYDEGALFPGFAILGLGLIGAVGGIGRRPEAARFRWIAHVACAGTFMFLAATIVALVTDFRITSPIRLSISSPQKPLTGFLVCLAAWMLVSPRMRAVFRMRDAAVFYVATAVLMWMFSLGPEVRFAGEKILDTPPYSWLLLLPGTDGLRVPARFWMLALMSLCVLAGYAVAAARRGRTLIATLAAIVLLGEGWMNLAAAPIPRAAGPEPRSPDAVMLTLPIGAIGEESVIEFHAVVGGYRTMNGYSGYTPPHAYPLELGARLHESSVLTQTRELTPLHVNVLADNSDGNRSWIAAQPGAQLVAEAGGRAMYLLPKIDERATAAVTSTTLPFTITRASCGMGWVANISDGSLRTRWDCGPAQPGQRLEVDLGTIAGISSLGLMLGPYASDSPRYLVVEVSDDGASWRNVWSGAPIGDAFRAALRDPAICDVRISFPATRGRLIRLTQTGQPTQWYWSIAELAVYGQRIPTS